MRDSPVTVPVRGHSSAMMVRKTFKHFYEAVLQFYSLRSRTRYQMLQMRTIQRGSRQHHAMHQLHRPHAFEGMSTVGRVVHQIRQRRIDSTRLRADMCGKGGLEHEDVLLPAGRLQFRTFVDVQQHSRHPRCLDGGSPRRTNSSWLIRR